MWESFLDREFGGWLMSGSKKSISDELDEMWLREVQRVNALTKEAAGSYSKRNAMILDEYKEGNTTMTALEGG